VDRACFPSGKKTLLIQGGGKSWGIKREREVDELAVHIGVK
jgi:hypothetical protein